MWFKNQNFPKNGFVNCHREQDESIDSDEETSGSSADKELDVISLQNDVPLDAETAPSLQYDLTSGLPNMKIYKYEK